MGWRQIEFPLLVLTPTGGFTGLFVYSGAPATGTLIASIAARTGTDPFGNQIQATVASYSPGDNGTLVRLTGGGITWQSENPASLLTLPGQQLLVDALAASTAPYISFSSPAAVTSLTSRLGMLLFGESQDGSKLAQLLLTTNLGATHGLTNALLELAGVQAFQNQAAPGNVSGASQLYANTSGVLAQVNQSGFFSNLSGAGLADTTTYTVTAAAATTCSKVWTIPAGDAVVGGVYKLVLIIGGTQGSTAQPLTFNANVAGDTGPANTLPATFCPAGVGFAIHLEMTITVISTGAGGTVHNFGKIVTGSATVPGAVQEWLFLGRAFNTTAAESVSVQAKWGAVTGAPTMTTEVNYLQRIA